MLKFKDEYQYGNTDNIKGLINLSKHLKNTIVFGTLISSLLVLPGCETIEDKMQTEKERHYVSAIIVDEDSYVILDNIKNILIGENSNNYRLQFEDDNYLIIDTESIKVFKGPNSKELAETYVAMQSEQSGKSIIYYSDIMKEAKAKGK